MNRREFLNYCVKTGMAIGFGSLSSCVTTNKALPTAPGHATARQGVKPARIDAHGHTVLGLTADIITIIKYH